MKLQLTILLFVGLLTRCSKGKFEMADCTPVKCVTEYCNQVKTHYREYNSLDLEVKHIYYHGNIEELEYFAYDIYGNVRTNVKYRSGKLIDSVAYEYEYDHQKRPVRVTRMGTQESVTEYREYSTSGDSLIERNYQNKDDYDKGYWITEVYKDKCGNWFMYKSNPVFGFDPPYTYHLNSSGEVDYRVHGTDTTRFVYNQEQKVISETSHSRFETYTYDSMGNRTSWTIRWLNPVRLENRNDTLTNCWTYEWTPLLKL